MEENIVVEDIDVTEIFSGDDDGLSSVNASGSGVLDVFDGDSVFENEVGLFGDNGSV